MHINSAGESGGGAASAPTTAIVLAAGASRRMGVQNKLLLPMQGQAMVRSVVQQALGVCRQVIVVLGHEAAQVQAVLADLPVTFVFNPAHTEGMGASVRVGATQVASGHAALVCLGDMPGVSAEVLRALILAGQEGAAACQPVYQGQVGNPIWWAPDQVGALRQASGDEGARHVLRSLRQAGRVCEVPVKEAGVVWDIDTPAAWQQAETRLGQPSNAV